MSVGSIVHALSPGSWHVLLGRQRAVGHYQTFIVNFLAFCILLGWLLILPKCLWFSLQISPSSQFLADHEWEKYSQWKSPIVHLLSRDPDGGPISISGSKSPERPPGLLAGADITDILFIFSLSFHFSPLITNFLLPCHVRQHPRPSFNFYFLGKHLDIQLRSVIFCRHIRRQLVAAPGGQQTFCADQAVCSCEVWHRGPISYFIFFYFDSWTEGLKFLSKFCLRHDFPGIWSRSNKKRTARISLFPIDLM